MSWAAHRAAASVSGGDGGAWLDGDAARGFTCDASVTPVVVGEVNPGALEGLVRLCVQLDKLRHHPVGDTTRGWDALEQAIIGKTMNLLVHFENLP